VRKFTHINATSVEDAVSLLKQYSGKAKVIAGGTDLLGTMIDEIHPREAYPEVIINLKTIKPSLEYIKEEGGVLKMGALTKLYDIEVNSIVKSKYLALSQAAHAVASPHIREMGTIGGNICQETRCLYYRAPNNRFYCLRKGGGMCYAMSGDNRFHSIFGAVKGCIAVNPSDIAPVLIALDAKIVTSKRNIEAEKFWDVRVPGSTVLDSDEIVTEIQIPAPPAGTKSAFTKLRIRKSIDFPLVNCAALIGGNVARICLNAVYNIPYRATKAEDAIRGKTIDVNTAEAAAAQAVSGAVPLTYNRWKIQAAKGVVKKTILACK
jgi:xanthine dehydrogenase YagS FAD-binding subunit